ncbi:helix-turn-helix domain-containing protein [Bacillus mobilis]|uniref:helix-turn-helix domain-containing protein n=1 Tax=Bacillus mobilis TaxID=2026190 RepID=UPI00362AE450
MSSALLRGLKILELLATEPEGLALGDIATRLQLPNSAVHRPSRQAFQRACPPCHSRRRAPDVGSEVPRCHIEHQIRPANAP